MKPRKQDQQRDNGGMDDVQCNKTKIREKFSDFLFI